HACYKIMFCMGLIDISSVVPNALLAGYYLLVGGSACTYPLLNMWLGFVAFSFWCGYSGMSVLLGLNRALDFEFPRLAETLFSGYRVYVWILCGPIAFILYVMITNVPCVFNPILAGYFFEINIFKPMMPNTVHLFNNLGVTTCSIILNMMMVTFLFKMTRKAAGDTAVTRMQRVVVIQCLLICSMMMTASAIYCLMQFIPVPPSFVIGSTIMWQFSNGAPGIIYLIVNKSMRKAYFSTFFGWKTKLKVNVSTTSNNSAKNLVAAITPVAQEGQAQPEAVEEQIKPVIEDD
ncbi:unnamed protein product, partial [Mesorhabditis spiculigera]